VRHAEVGIDRICAFAEGDMCVKPIAENGQHRMVLRKHLCHKARDAMFRGDPR
jgi:hypothetical protein